MAAPTIALILGATFYLGSLLSALLGLPPSLPLMLAARILGAALVAVGLAVAGWVFRYRRPESMIASTYVTFMKMFRLMPMGEVSERKEPLVVAGPQKYVRNPLYFAVVVLSLGWGLGGASTSVLVGTLILVLWLRLFLIPFEEKELRALFGDQYVEYAEKVPALFPFTKRKR